MTPVMRDSDAEEMSALDMAVRARKRRQLQIALIGAVGGIGVAVLIARLNVMSYGEAIALGGSSGFGLGVALFLLEIWRRHDEARVQQAARELAERTATTLSQLTPEQVAKLEKDFGHPEDFGSLRGLWRQRARRKRGSER